MLRHLGVVMAVAWICAGCGGDSGDGNGEPDAYLPGCGNGVQDPGEECDEGAQNSDTEPDRCRTDCRQPYCGDTVKDSDENCDDQDLGLMTCDDFGHNRGTLACTSTCEFDLTGCYTCGNGQAEFDEQCDGADLDQQNCGTLTGLPQGDLQCTASCTFDTSQCHLCGNDQMEGIEACDGTDFGAATCQSLTGHPDGQLACTAGCSTIDATGCHTCGNLVLEGPEPCDGTELGGQECGTVGFDVGTLACRSDCAAFDTSGCVNCLSGFSVCDATCVDMNSDPLYCGQCGNQAHPCEYCVGGNLQSVVPYLACGGGSCEDVLSDPANCTTCGQACDVSQPYCIDGSCDSRSCADVGYAACGLNGDHCVDATRFNSSPVHCGGCDSPCGGAEFCIGGACTPYYTASPCVSCPCSVCGSDACCQNPYTGQTICVVGSACPS